MGRSFDSVDAARWLKASRALKKEDQVYGQKLAEMAKKHSSEALDDPLEAAVFSALMELVKKRAEEEDTAGRQNKLRMNVVRSNLYNY